MEIRTQVDLGAANTLACPAIAEYAVTCQSIEEVREAVAHARERGLGLTVLGGGSNVVLRRRVPGLVVLNRLPGVRFAAPALPIERASAVALSGVPSVPAPSDSSEASPENDRSRSDRSRSEYSRSEYSRSDSSRSDHADGGRLLGEERVHLHLGAGESWDAAVRRSLDLGYRGLENLILIPGSAGAAPIQNIGAYGAELADTLVEVTVLDARTDRVLRLAAADCRLGYRDSLFKQPEGASLIVLGLTLELSRVRPFNLDYAGLRSAWESNGSSTDPWSVARLVEALRRSRLPDPAELPNAGSFFKNPLVDEQTYGRLKDQFPDLVAYPQARDAWKLAAGWLIERCGWRGRLEDGCGCHARQALVLVNPGRRSGTQVLAVAEQVREDVQRTFGVLLEAEPVSIGCD